MLKDFKMKMTHNPIFLQYTGKNSLELKELNPDLKILENGTIIVLVDGVEKICNMGDFMVRNVYGTFSVMKDNVLGRAFAGKTVDEMIGVVEELNESFDTTKIK